MLTSSRMRPRLIGTLAATAICLAVGTSPSLAARGPTAVCSVSQRLALNHEVYGQCQIARGWVRMKVKCRSYSTKVPGYWKFGPKAYASPGAISNYFLGKVNVLAAPDVAPVNVRCKHGILVAYVQGGVGRRTFTLAKG